MAEKTASIWEFAVNAQGEGNMTFETGNISIQQLKQYGEHVSGSACPLYDEFRIPSM